jgi:hypothetical protein
MRRLDDRVLLEALVVVPLVRIAIALLPFRLVHRFVLTRRRRATANVPRERITRAVAAVARRVPRATCLTQVVAAALLCSRHGHATELRLGVMKNGATLAAHAWLESDGRPFFGEPEPGTFVVLA